MKRRAAIDALIAAGAVLLLGASLAPGAAHAKDPAPNKTVAAARTGTTCPLVVAPNAQGEPSLLEQAAELAAEQRFIDAIALYESLEHEASVATQPRRLAFIRASLLRARIDSRAPNPTIEAAASLLRDLDALDDPTLTARIRLHVAQSLIEATLADPDLQPQAAPLVTGALASAESSTLAQTDAGFAAGVAGNQAEWLGLVQHDAEPALLRAQQAILLAQRAGDEAGTARWLALTGHIEAEAGRPGAALAAYRAAVVRLAAARGGLPAPNLASLRANQRRSDATYEALVDLLLARASTSEDDAEQQALLRETRRVLETRKAVELRDFFRDACLDAHRQAEPDDIPGTLVLYPVLLEDRMELIASRDGRFWQFTVPIGSAELAGLTRRYRSNLENLTTRRHLRESIALHELVIEPVLPLIEDEQSRSLVFVAEGSLRTIPIGALRDSVRGRYLIERIPVSVTPSLTLTNPGAVEPDRVRVLRAGISQSIDGFAALPAVAGELEAIGERYQGDELLDEAFDSASLADALERRPYGIVHIASHGEFLPDSSESYLLAWQDRITMDELSSLLGATQFRGQGVQLLTLSACQTAAGDERAALGLAGLAVKAGARSALATLWSISDVAASRLIDRFYEELAKPDVSRAEALRRAQLEISQQPEWAHPGYWAAFMLIGDWT